MNNLLACPICHGDLTELNCVSCNISFQQKNGVSSFICREMYPSAEAYAEASRIIDFWGNGWEKRLEESDHKPWFVCDHETLVQNVVKDIEFQKQSDSVMAVDLPLDSLKGKVALNIGCGAGTEASLLAYSDANCIAMDITSQAAQAAEYLINKIGGKGIGIQADTRFIPVKSDSIDIVYSSGVLHHSPEIAKSISEIHRVLRPGGKAYIMLYATWSVLFVQMRLMLSMGEKAWETGNRKNPCTTTYTKNECIKLFSQFSNVQVRKTGENLKHLKIVGKCMPASLDRILYPVLGPRLNIVVEKPL